MRYSLLIAGLLAITLLLFGCSSDKPSQPVTPKPQRIVVTQGTSAPSMDHSGGTVWNAITPTAVDLSTSLAPSPVMAGITAVADSVYIQALTFNDTLYLRIRWADYSHSVWRGAYSVRSISDSLDGRPVTYFNASDSIGRQEDQLWVLFAGLANGDWDGLNWRALTTDSTFLVEGINLHRASASDPWSHVTDEGTMEVYRRNINLVNQGYPAYFHKDTSSYHGYTLFDNDNLRAQDFFIRGWEVGQEVPYYLLDSTKWRLPAAERGSRWDTRSISDYAPPGAERPEYTVVLCRPMNTGYADDVVLTDSVKTKIGVFDNQMDINIGGTGRGFTKEFWLIF